jgi:transposase
MITAGAEKRVLVATKPVDFRKQADGLAAIVQAALGADPFCGTVYVFRPKRTDRVKLLWWDGRSGSKAGSFDGRRLRMGS